MRHDPFYIELGMRRFMVVQIAPGVVEMAMLHIKHIGQAYNPFIQGAGNNHDLESRSRLRYVSNDAVPPRVRRRGAGIVGVESRQRCHGEDLAGARTNYDSRNTYW